MKMSKSVRELKKELIAMARPLIVISNTPLYLAASPTLHRNGLYYRRYVGSFGAIYLVINTSAYYAPVNRSTFEGTLSRDHVIDLFLTNVSRQLILNLLRYEFGMMIPS